MSGRRGEWARAFAPASVSNLTCGFDLLGFAVAEWGDVVEARATEQPGVRLLEISGDGGRLPTAAGENTAGVAALELLAGREDSGGVELRLRKGLPLASGLGSSAASSVAAALAVDAALGLDSGRDRLLAAALEGERVACGSRHPDNAVPSLLGGLRLIRQTEAGLAITGLAVPAGLTCVLLHPQCEVSTRSARAALPDSVPLEILTRQAGNLGALLVGLGNGDYDLIASAMVDHVAEPVRAAMTPGFEAVRRAALAAGAIGCGLSGSGPTIFAWCREPAGAAAVQEAMRRALGDETGLPSESLVTPVDVPGARLLENGK